MIITVYYRYFFFLGALEHLQGSVIFIIGFFCNTKKALNIYLYVHILFQQNKIICLLDTFLNTSSPTTTITTGTRIWFSLQEYLSTCSAAYLGVSIRLSQPRMMRSSRTKILGLLCCVSYFNTLLCWIINYYIDFRFHFLNLQSLHDTNIYINRSRLLSRFGLSLCLLQTQLRCLLYWAYFHPHTSHSCQHFE